MVVSRWNYELIPRLGNLDIFSRPPGNFAQVVTESEKYPDAGEKLDFGGTKNSEETVYCFTNLPKTNNFNAIHLKEFMELLKLPIIAKTLDLTWLFFTNTKIKIRFPSTYKDYVLFHPKAPDIVNRLPLPLRMTN